MNVDKLAQIIRRVDGDNTMGAGALADAIIGALKTWDEFNAEFFNPTPTPQPAQPDLEVVAYTNEIGLIMPEGKALIWKEFDLRWPIRLVTYNDAMAAITLRDSENENNQAHIAALTAKVEELTRERDEKKKSREFWQGTANTWSRRAEAAEARIADLEKERDGLREALEPFASSVFNDNGDVTFDYTAFNDDDLFRAYRLIKRARALHPTSSREGE